MLAALCEHPHTLVLLDGYYYNVPAVTHKELVYALDAGVRVIGAASLGALRAAELAPFGMIGAGRVYEQFRDGVLDGDDEVALLHATAEHGYRPLTVALVDIRQALEGLDGGGALVEELKALPFTERHPRRVTDLARRHLGEAAARELAARLAAGSLKRRDALLALELAATQSPPVEPRRRHDTGYLAFYKERHLRLPGGPALIHAWNLAQLFHPEAARFVHRLRVRALLATAAARGGLRPSAGREREVAGELRACHERRLGRPVLPEPEYAAEAQLHLLAGEARSAAGGTRAALAALARRFGAEDLAGLLGPQSGFLPAWWAARAFTFTPAFAPALEAAAEAEQIHGCFERWAEGARVEAEDLWKLAGEIWGCAPGEMSAEAERRGLFRESNLGGGLRDALELVAAAERLPRPLNAYPEKREALKSAALEHPLDDPEEGVGVSAPSILPITPDSGPRGRPLLHAP